MSRSTSHRSACALAALLLAPGCGPSGSPAEPSFEILHILQPPTWFEDGWSVYRVSADGGLSLFGARFGLRLIDLNTGREEPDRMRGTLDRVLAGTFGASGRLIRRGFLGPEPGWFLEEGGEIRLLPIPTEATPGWSPDGSKVAYFRGTGGTGEGMYVRTPDQEVRHDVGGPVSGFAWSVGGDALFVLVMKPDGLASLLRIEVAEGAIETVADDLDTTWRFSSIAPSPDGRALYLALSGPVAPDPVDRHRPVADRDLDIYELDLESGILTAVVEAPGDDFYPVVAAGHLYWTHNEWEDDVVVVPVDGGDPRTVVADAQIPYWRPDGTRIAFTYGGWRVVDWALNLDAGVVDVDGEAHPISDPQPLVVGYHEDFTPAWSPDGRWLAYHSHRSEAPVGSYSAEGSTDDLYLRIEDAPPEEEIRLTEFGWEVGMADWAPDGRRLVFDSWERGGPRGVSKPWIVTIDPGTGAPLSVERLPLPEGVDRSLLAAWSPIQDEIAVVVPGTESGRGDGRDAIWILAPDGSSAEKLLEFDATTYGGLDWTPDGLTIIYGAFDGSRMQLFSMGRNGGRPRQLTRGPDDLVQPQVSPDGRWIAASRLHHEKQLRRIPLR